MNKIINNIEMSNAVEYKFNGRASVVGMVNGKLCVSNAVQSDVFDAETLESIINSGKRLSGKGAKPARHFVEQYRASVLGEARPESTESTEKGTGSSDGGEFDPTKDAAGGGACGGSSSEGAGSGSESTGSGQGEGSSSEGTGSDGQGSGEGQGQGQGSGSEGEGSDGQGEGCESSSDMTSGSDADAQDKGDAGAGGSGESEDKPTKEDLEKAVEQARKNLDKAEKSEKEAQSEKDKVEQEPDLQSYIDECEKHIEDMSKYKDELEQKLKESGDAQELEDKKSEVEAQRDALKSEVDKQIAEKKQEMADAVMDEDFDKAKECKDAVNGLEASKSAIDEGAQKELDELQSQIDSLGGETAQEKAEVEQALEEAEAIHEDLKQKQESKGERKDATEKALADAQKKREEAQKRHDEAVEALKKFKDEESKKKRAELPECPKGVTDDFREAFDFISMLRKEKMGMGVYLHGPAGTGKSRMARNLAEAHKLDFYPFKTLTDETDIFGFTSPITGEYVSKGFDKAAENGGLVLLDEFDRSNPTAVVAMNNLISDRVWFNPKTLKTEAIHDDCVFIVTANTAGAGGDLAYVAAEAQDLSSLDRFIPIEILYDKKVENLITGNNKELVDFIHEVRKASDKGMLLRAVFSYRALVTQTKMEENGIINDNNLSVMLKKTIFKFMTDEDIETIRTNFSNAEKWNSNRYALAMRAMNLKI